MLLLTVIVKNVVNLSPLSPTVGGGNQDRGVKAEIHQLTNRRALRDSRPRLSPFGGKTVQRHGESGV